MRVRHESDNPEFVVSAVVETMQELKAKEVVSLDLRDIHSAVTDYFVICHAQSKTQVSAIADRILDNLPKELPGYDIRYLESEIPPDRNDQNPYSDA